MLQLAHALALDSTVRPWKLGFKPNPYRFRTLIRPTCATSGRPRFRRRSCPKSPVPARCSTHARSEASAVPGLGRSRRARAVRLSDGSASKMRPEHGVLHPINTGCSNLRSGAPRCPPCFLDCAIQNTWQRAVSTWAAPDVRCAARLSNSSA